MPAPGTPGTTGTGNPMTPYLYAPLLLLTAIPATIWAVATIRGRAHARDDDHRRCRRVPCMQCRKELEAIDVWLDAIRAAQKTGK